jgi:hypothetical protein
VDKNLTHYPPSFTLTAAVADNAAGSLTNQSANNSWALFGGGYDVNRSSSSEITLVLYGTSLTTPPNLDLSRGNLAAAGSDKYVLFAGGGYGFDGSQAVMVTDAYNANATKVTAGLNHLTYPCSWLAGATLNTGST